MLLRPAPKLPSEIAAAYRESSTRVTLLDIGANGSPPPIWRPLAPHAHYVGVGPGSQPLAPDWEGKFAKAQFDDRILTTTDSSSTTFYTTTDPAYSSVLRPNPRAAVDFLQPRLTVDRVVALPAISLNALVSQCGLDSIDWIHVNVNGSDVPLIQSLRDEMFRRILAVDIYLNLTDLYVDDASGISRLPELIGAGFWLSRLHGYGPLRFRRDTLAKLHAIDPQIDESLLSSHVRAPAWVLVRLFRTADWLDRHDFSPREYLLLWTSFPVAQRRRLRAEGLEVIAHDLKEDALCGITRLVGSGRFGHARRVRVRRAARTRPECGRNGAIVPSPVAVSAPPKTHGERKTCHRPSSVDCTGCSRNPGVESHACRSQPASVQEVSFQRVRFSWRFQSSERVGLVLLC